MGIARTDQQDYLKVSQMETLALLCERGAGYFDIGSNTLRLAARAFREVISNRATLKNGKIPLDFERLLLRLKDEFDDELLSTLSRAEVLRFETGSLWLHFKEMSDELSVFWKKRDLEVFLARLYGRNFKLQFRKCSAEKQIAV